ncbi:hypothetical protein AGMMS49965_03110 [Bacteroidia bacterium]|nr:hypothetical protein AGMMS49965_03110 [Bacteroidia bacterium]
MKKLLFATTFLLFASHHSYSQEVFPLDNATWTELLHPDAEPLDDDSPPREDKYISYSLRGDTVVDGIVRSKLYFSPDVQQDYSELTGFIHVDADKVYFRPDASTNLFYSHYIALYDYVENQDMLLYDFSLKIGDKFGYTLQEIDYVSIGGSERKRFCFYWELDPYFRQYWIEGMGSTQSLFDPIESIPACTYWIKLICFSQNDEVLWLSSDFKDCPLKKGNGANKIETADREAVSIHYIAENRLIVSSLPMQQLQIYNLNGALLQSIKVDGELQYALSKHSPIAGVYLAKIRLQNGSVHTEKIIVK